MTPAGQLDPAFGSGGATTTQIGQDPTPANNLSQAYAIRRQGSRFVVSDGVHDSGGHNQFAMARYTASGGLDLSFGSSGRVLNQFSAATANPAAIAFGSVVQPNGKIVLTGGANDISEKAVYLVARYTPDGALDPSFGSSGVVQRQLASPARETPSPPGRSGSLTARSRSQAPPATLRADSRC
jgi:uncharacterized delta-60 repeat protein